MQTGSLEANHSFFAVLFLCALFVVGCASQREVASFDASAGRMEYETSEMIIIRRISRSGYGDASSIALQGTARCEGKNCTPEVARLMFSVRGNTGVNFQDRTIRLVADGEQYEWKDFMAPQQEEVFTQSSVTGQIGGVRVRLSQLEQIANASSVEGSIGNRSFEIGDSQKAELRHFLSAMRNPADAMETQS